MLKNMKIFNFFVRGCLNVNNLSQNSKKKFSTNIRLLSKSDYDGKDKKSTKVKLYPGYQISHEEMHQSIVDDTKVTNQDFFAKKVIEDFYGLNELEYEKEENQFVENNETYEYEEFNLDNAINILRNENVQDIACIEIPKEINYADYMIIGSCLSDKHLNSVFQIVNKKYKHTKQESDSFLNRKSGKESKWCAIDTGKIVIHLFLPEYREYYDLECLWTCGSEYDEKYLQFREQQREMEQKLTLLEVDETLK
ncbi:unnamed protein product [Brachionus calyciflorus]|uniref:Mitochondrial assembly of ribosomal large subunit protein 1 n=1 Tax=Brachionus calyciflorus TaxID=104777 RepID=A0A813NJP7_9BILA|nr:unnamed protein product [Brachionus calyciflorus]